MPQPLSPKSCEASMSGGLGNRGRGSEARPLALRSRVTPYAVAVGVTALAILVSLLLDLPIDAYAFPLLLATVMVSAWYGGLGPGLVSTLLGATTGTLVSLSPAYSAGGAPSSIVPLAAFLLEALVICGLSTVLRAAQRRAEALAVSEKAARGEVEATAQRLRALQTVTDTALGYLHLDDLLRELIERIRETLAADTVVILLLTEDGQELAVRAAHGLEQELLQGIRIPMGRGIAGRIAAGREPKVFEDMASEEIASPILREKGLTALLGVPLIVEGRTIGVVHVGTLRPRRFGEDEIRLLRLVADRIAIAIDHARLFEAERHARSAAETAERRFRLLVDGVADYALYMLDDAGRVVSWNAGAERVKGYRAEQIIGRHFGIFYSPEDVRRGVPEQVLARAAADGRCEEERWRLRRDGSRFWSSVTVTALRDAEGLLMGFATLTHDLTERRRVAEVRTRLLEQVISAQESEQRRLARELHDETGQSLTSLLVGLRVLEDAATLEEAVARAAELRRLTAQTLDEVRRLARGLRPTVLDDLGLVPALEHYAAEYAESHGIAVDVEARSLDGARLPPAVETTLYRIVQEALTNVAKHAGARTVSIVLQRQRTWVQAIVADDGCGFDVDKALKAEASWTHLGLHGMWERAALLNGSVTIESTPGEGTTVYARLPTGEGRDGADPSPDRG
jgi:PAS domain S-box-containing protein